MIKIMDQYLTFALPKGKLGGKSLTILKAVGLPVEGVETEGRQLVFPFPEAQRRYLICRPTDIPTYVEYGAADVGIAGKDTVAAVKQAAAVKVEPQGNICLECLPGPPGGHRIHFRRSRISALPTAEDLMNNDTTAT
jgi:hypothetical protein